MSIRVRQGRVHRVDRGLVCDYFEETRVLLHINVQNNGVWMWTFFLFSCFSRTRHNYTHTHEQCTYHELKCMVVEPSDIINMSTKKKKKMSTNPMKRQNPMMH